MLNHKAGQKAAVEQRIRELAVDGMGELKTARTLGIGVSVAQRVVLA